VIQVEIRSLLGIDHDKDDFSGVFPPQILESLPHFPGTIRKSITALKPRLSEIPPSMSEYRVSSGHPYKIVNGPPSESAAGKGPVVLRLFSPNGVPHNCSFPHNYRK